MKYNTINEEMLRIKSLFTEERLFGNLVDKENILTEQLGPSFRKISKTIDDIKALKSKIPKSEIPNINKMLDAEISNTRDLLDNLTTYGNIWKMLVPDDELNKVKAILNQIDKIYKGDLTKVDLFKKNADGIMPIDYVTSSGGLKEMLLDLVKNAGGKWTSKPIKPINKPVTDLVVTGENVHGSIVKYKKNDYLVPTKDDGTLDLDPEGTITILFKDGSERKIKPDGRNIEDIDWEDVTDIGGKPVRTTPIQRVVKIVGDKADDAAEEGEGIFVELRGKESVKAAKEGGFSVVIGKNVSDAKVIENTPADKTSKKILSEDPRFMPRFHKFLATAFEWYADPFQGINKMKKNSEFIKKIFPAEVIKHDKNIGRSYLWVTTKRFAINIGTTSALLGYALEPGSEYVPSSISFENSDDYTFSTIIFTYIRNTLEMRYYFKFILERDFRNMCNRISEIGIDCEDLKKDFLKETERLTLDGDCTPFASQKSGEKYVRSNLVKYMNKNYGVGDTDMQSTGGDIVGWMTETTFWGNIVRLWTYINDETGTNPFSQAVAAKVLSCSEGVTNTKITPIPGTEEKIEVENATYVPKDGEEWDF